MPRLVWEEVHCCAEGETLIGLYRGKPRNRFLPETHGLLQRMLLSRFNFLTPQPGIPANILLNSSAHTLTQDCGTQRIQFPTGFTVAVHKPLIARIAALIDGGEGGKITPLRVDIITSQRKRSTVALPS